MATIDLEVLGDLLSIVFAIVFSSLDKKNKKATGMLQSWAVTAGFGFWNGLKVHGYSGSIASRSALKS